MSGPRIEVGVLGMSTLTVDGVPAPLGARRMRSLLAALVLGPGLSVSTDRLVDALWEHQPSEGAINTLQGYVSRMRRLMEPDPQVRGDIQFIQHAGGAYALVLGQEGQVDAHRFDASISAAQAVLLTHGDPARPQIADRADQIEVHRERLDRALSTWRGEPYADLPDDDVAVVERRRLSERRVDGQTALLVMDLKLGRAAEAATGLEELVDAHPLRELLWRLWAVALVRSDRQAHALEVLARLRLMLSSELGIDPSPAVTTLQKDILRQDSSVVGAPLRPAAQAAATKEASTPARAAHLSTLVGRDRELELLHDTVRATVSGRGRHVVVVAEPGMGKSRLITEVADWSHQHHGVTVVTVRGAGSIATPPFWSLDRAIADLSARTGVVPLETPSETSSADPSGRAAAFADFVRAATLTGPILIAVEELRHVDDGTLMALTHVVETATDAPVMLVAVCRPGWQIDAAEDLTSAIVRDGGLWLELKGLDVGETRLLADAITPERLLKDRDVKLLRERAAGNPLHLATLLAHATDGVPPPLLALVRAQLREVPSETVRALRAAALVGRRFPADLMTPHTPDHDVHLGHAMDGALQSGLVREVDDDTWEFSSPILHEAVLALSPRHDRVAARARPGAATGGVDSVALRKTQLALVTGAKEA